MQPSTSSSSVKSNKRKLADAMQSLDDAMSPRAITTDYPSPAKKAHTVRSLYSTLAKYGINVKAKQPASSDLPASPSVDLSKTPHLAAILARTASKTRNAIPHRFRSRPLSFTSAAAEYRPSSTPSFLSRLATFKLNTYSNKPPAIDAVAASKCGWINDGKDRLVCGICAVSWVLAGREGMNRDAANALVEKQRAHLVDMHKDGCPWKTRQCDADIYRISLSSPTAMAKEIKTQALELESVLEGVDVQHPLSSKQLQQLMTTMASVRLDGYNDPAPLSGEGTDSLAFPSLHQEPSQIAILTAFFGWSLAPPAPPPPPPRTHTLSMSRASSVAFSVPSTPRGALRSDLFVTPSASAPRLSLSRLNSLRSSPTSSISGDLQKRDSSLLRCALCHRRIGLWAVTAPVPRGSEISSSAPAVPSRQIDLLKEHRPYCPYVVRSTTVPSLPIPQLQGSTESPTRAPLPHSSSSASLAQLNGVQNGAIEGWRAVLTVVTRYRMSQKRRDGLLQEISERVSRGSSGAASPDSSFVLVRSETMDSGVSRSYGGDAETNNQMDTDADPVEAMMAGVKSKGGKELLKYVKGLLG
ncbi:hypothetical protein HETIRDRAFT_474283 [Heterobasidion irregulare TC 32-1]|uniref:C3HC-type domain-containing protein n=1 Tax=Heterobasidion irregulare (strain TC 32-1) TaxID=747525 RepID=W4KBA3_HETIT|nr:uncharacterized protein HETIRDRAFT_474283 [Heterobasidion irregulare TC 32-1]ETW83127.1 hypothetical protein HETIRDRAFT_474283 [Heterobasidion irregulare TC 32-1]